LMPLKHEIFEAFRNFLQQTLTTVMAAGELQ